MWMERVRVNTFERPISKDTGQLFIKINMTISISTKQRENPKNIKARKFNVAETENKFMKQHKAKQAL